MASEVVKRRAKAITDLWAKFTAQKRKIENDKEVLAQDMLIYLYYILAICNQNVKLTATKEERDEIDLIEKKLREDPTTFVPLRSNGRQTITLQCFHLAKDEDDQYNGGATPYVPVALIYKLNYQGIAVNANGKEFRKDNLVVYSGEAEHLKPLIRCFFNSLPQGEKELLQAKIDQSIPTTSPPVGEEPSPVSKDWLVQLARSGAPLNESQKDDVITELLRQTTNMETMESKITDLEATNERLRANEQERVAQVEALMQALSVADAEVDTHDAV